MATGDDGGIGGKFSRRPFRRPSTPYDRPPTALRNPNGNGGNGWLSKLVDPASKIISGSAVRLFFSVFRKRLPAPAATIPETNLEPRNELPREVCIEQGIDEGENQNRSFESSGINELEQLLKKKTFTRIEFDRLTELLRSRTVDLPKDDENKRAEPSASQLVATQVREEHTAISAQENGVETCRFFRSISTPMVPDEEGASPAELSKAYMGSRPLKSPNMLHAPRSAGRLSSVPRLSENRYPTSRPQGRSAMYSMARSPYNRVHSKATLKGAETSDDGYAGSLVPQWTRVDSTLSGVKQVLKRTSSVLDNDFGSVGPIRRIRQKSNLTSPSKNVNSLVPGSPLSISQVPVGSYTVQGSLSSMQKPLLLDEPQYNTSNLQGAENGDNKLSTTSSAFVPTQSSEMARKILQQLDKLVPSPKEKPLESKVAMERGKSPSKLTLNMSNGLSFKSTDDIQPPKLQNVQVSGTLEDLSETQLLGSGNSIFGKQDRIEVNGPVKTVQTGIGSSSEVGGVKSAVNSVKGTFSDARHLDSGLFGFAADLPQSKRDFQMSAPEDALELDDFNHCSKNAFTPWAAGKVEPESYMSERKAIVTETVKAEKPLASSSESKPPVAFFTSIFTSIKGADGTSRASDSSIVAAKDVGSASPTSSAADTLKLSPPVPAAQSSSLFNNSVPTKEQLATPMFSFGSKTNEKGPLFIFSSTTNSINGTSGMKFATRSDSKSEILNSNVTIGANPPEATSSAKDEKNPKAGDLNKSSENAISGISTSATPNIFSFGASTNSSLGNGSLTSTSSSFSVSAAPAAPIFGSPISLISSSSIAATSGSSSRPISTAEPVFSAASIVKFGSGSLAAVACSNSVLLHTSTSSLDSVDLESRTKQASSPFSMAGSSIVVATSALTNPGSSIFGFGASGSSSSTMSSLSASNSLQSSTHFDATVGSLLGTASGTTPFTHSMHSQFGSSASSSTFGLSSTSSFGSASSSFSSAKLFGSGSSFALSSSASFSAGTSSSGSGANFPFAPGSSATSLFSSSSQPTTSSIFCSGFGSKSSATGFSFGGSSAAAAAGGSSTPLTFCSPLSASSGSLFSFTSAPAPAASSSSLSPAQPVFGMTNPAIGFGSASLGNDQMNIEDSMAEDTVQASAPVAPAFGQLASSPSPLNFGFGSPAVPSSRSSVFQFGNHQNPVAAPQSPSPFPGGSFSLGTGSVDKSNRKIVKIRRDKLRKK